MSEKQCWVPHCKASQDKEPKILFPLPRDLKYRETWLALTGKKFTSEKQVYFCQSHFRKSALQALAGKIIGLNPGALPFYGMPQMICRTCLCTISSSSLFCVVSSTIPSPMPVELMSELVTCRPEALYRILTFCIPNLNLEENPPALVCIKCYHNIWQYFVFKLQCNAMEQRLWNNVPPERYGKILLCRSCPTTSNTRYFCLNETQPMGQVFKNMFSSNYPTNVVPLKLCINCWNIVYKLAEFHKQCVMYSGWIRGGENQVEVAPPIQAVKEKDLQDSSSRPGSNPVEIRQDNGASTSSSSNVPKPNEAESSEVQSVTIDSSTEILEKESEQPQIEEGGPENSRSEEIEPSPSIVESELILANLIKFSEALEPGLDPAERAKIDLEMWVNVVKVFHSFGFTYTLEHVQELWRTIKNAAKTARKTIGPMTYTDHLTNVYLYKVEALESSAKTDANKPVDSDKRGRDLRNETVEIESVETETSVVSEEKSTDPPVAQPVKMLPRPRNPDQPVKKKLKAWERRRDTRLVWTKESKLELVREIRKEYNCLIEEEEELLKCSPWKKIVERVVAKGLVASDFPKVYSEWSKMKMSARIHEKNGLDVVDDEVWDLLQLHADVQKGLTKKNAPNSKPTDAEPSRPEITPPPAKIPKLSSPSPKTPVRDPAASPKPHKKGVKSRRPYVHATDEEKLEILGLIEREFDRMLTESGTISTSLTVILDGLNYKNYSKHSLKYVWQKLVSLADDTSNPVGERMARLVELYKQKRLNKAGRPANRRSSEENDSKPKERTVRTRLSSGELSWEPMKTEESEDDSEQSEKRAAGQQTSLSSDKKKLDLIAVLRTFGNEVFKKGDRTTRREFWTRVTTALQVRGHDLTTKEVQNTWSHMQRSAKLTWSQDGRKPRVGDHELIEFMTEVIKEKENRSASKPDLNVKEEENNNKTDKEKRDEAVDKVESVSIESSSEEEAEESVALDDYSYVSFEDIRKYCEMKKEDEPKSKPVVASTVIEILDSDEE